MTKTATSPTPTSKLPQSTRPLKMDKDLAAALEGFLRPHTGKALERAQAAILQVRASGIALPFDQLVERYEQAIAAAVTDS